MKKMLQFGAGNIGRSFTGQVFACAGWEVVFVDVNPALLEAINKRHSYRVIVKQNEEEKEIYVEHVRAVSAENIKAVIQEIITADIICTSVGQNALPAVIRLLCKGLSVRFSHDAVPLNIIIAENIRNGADFFRSEILKNIPGFDVDTIGLIETSIGKMVPLMTDRDRKADPLWVFSESYNTLIVDKHGFKGEIPAFSALKAVENIAAYVDRKLFIHNLGHSSTAYLAWKTNPRLRSIWQALERDDIREPVRRVMMLSAAALNKKYPLDLKMDDLETHVDDLLRRFGNRSLNDTVFRVGRDLKRKLSRNDRIIGPMLLCKEYTLDVSLFRGIFLAAVQFRAVDEHGNMFPPDVLFHREYDGEIDSVLRNVSGLSDNEISHLGFTL